MNLIRCYLRDLPAGQLVFAATFPGGDVAVVADRAHMDRSTLQEQWELHNAVLAALDDPPGRAAQQRAAATVINLVGLRERRPVPQGATDERETARSETLSGRLPRRVG